MRRRQAWATEPQKEVKTQFVIPNEQKEPAVANRRRFELSRQFGTEVNLSDRLVQQIVSYESKKEDVVPVEVVPQQDEIGLGTTGKRRGRPFKNQTN